YRSATASLVNHLSEAALNRARIHVEVEWFIHLADTGAVPGVDPLTDGERAFMRAIPATFDQSTIDRLAELERETVHDVKAVEYFIKEQLTHARSVVGKGSRLPDLGELVHFACTSEDINNLSY